MDCKRDCNDGIDEQCMPGYFLCDGKLGDLISLVAFLSTFGFRLHMRESGRSRVGLQRSLEYAISGLTPLDLPVHSTFQVFRP